MPTTHDREHSHGNRPKPLLWTLALVSVYMVAEVVGGLLTNSHIWTITSGFESLSVHVRVGQRDHDEVLAEIRDLLRERFDIEHSTVQIETRSGDNRHDGCDDDP